MSSGIKVDANWLNGYARTAEQAGDDLTSALQALQGTPLSSTAFGELGRTVGSADAYNTASTTLQQQVTRAAAALHAAATSLRGIAGAHTSVDADQAAALSAVHRA
jgi:uncharacterized protein YukE